MSERPSPRPLGPAGARARLEELLQIGPRRRFAIVSFGGQLVNVALLFAISVLTARLLGPDGKGVYSAWTMATLGGAAVLGGSVSIGLGRGWLHGDQGTLPGAAMRHMGLVAAAMLVLTPIGLLAGLPPVPLITCITIGVPLTVAINDLLLVLLAAKRPWALHAARIIGALPLAAGLGAVALSGTLDSDEALDLAFVLFAAGAGLSVLIALIAAVRRLGFTTSASVREYARRGEGAYAGMIADWIVARADRFVVIGIAGAGALGIYSVAVNFAEISVLAGVAISQSLFEDHSTLNRAESKRVLKLSFSIVCVAATAVIAAGFFLIGPVFGDEFEAARWVTVLLWPGVIVRSIAMAGGSMLLARGEGRKNSRITIITALVAIPLWIALTYALDVEGAAIAVSLSYALQAALVLRAVFPPVRAGTPNPG
jgi:O-antigen/teichoic acid export membrane protein